MQSQITLRLGGFALLAAALCFSCGSSSDDDSGAGGGGAGGTTPVLDVPDSLSFDAPATLTMIPGEQRNVMIVTDPPASYPVTLALIGDFKDASLDASEVWTAPDGRAALTLTAPTEPTTFTLRASVGDGAVVADVGVSVSASGFATLQLKPSYSGKRDVSYWAASVRAGVTCGELSGNPPDDGDLKGSAPKTQVPQIDGVPVGPTLAVTLRSAYNIAGCKDVSSLVADEITEVTIPVSDVPMKMSETDMNLTLSLDSAPYATLLSNVAVAASGALAQGSNDDVDAWLNAMEKATGSAQDAQAFAAARASQGWDATLTAKLGGASLAPSAVRTLVEGWLAKGISELSGAVLSGQLVSAGTEAGHAFVQLESVAGSTAKEAGFTVENFSAWSADPGDQVALGTSFFVVPSRLVCALARIPALDEVPQAKTVPEALAIVLDCDAIAAALVQDGTAPGESYAGCGAACTQALCQAGLSEMWENARDASVAPKSPLATMVISAAGNAKVDEYARPVQFSGAFVGNLDVGAKSLSISGKATGGPPPPPS